MSVYLDFMKSARKNRLRQLSKADPTLAQDYYSELSPQACQMFVDRGDIANFDTAGLFDATAGDYLGAERLIQMARANGQRRHLKLPFEHFAITLRQQLEDGSSIVDNVVLVHRLTDSITSLTRILHSPQIGWVLIPVSAYLHWKDGEIERMSFDFIDKSVDVDEATRDSNLSFALDVVIVFSELLNRPEVTVLERAPRLKFDLYNKGTKRNPIPVTKILRVNRDELVKVTFGQSSEGTGTPKCGHKRRGHWRRLPGGVGRRWIEEINVKGGPVGSVAESASYKLQNDAGRVVYSDLI